MTKGSLRLGVIGCGRVFERFHMAAIEASDVWHLAAVCEPDAARRSWAEGRLRGTIVRETLQAMLRDVELDAVLIATPPSSHLANIEAALHAGLHVLVEKPGGLSTAEAERIEALAARSGKLVWVGYNRRFRPSYRRLRRWLASKSPGRNVEVHFTLAVSVAEWESVSGYLGDSSMGGGILHDVASHQLDLLSWLYRQPIESVKVQSWSHRPIGGVAVEYGIRFPDGRLASCCAVHGNAYEELLVAETPESRLTVYPTGSATETRLRWPAPRRWSSARHWIDRKLIRLGLLQDELTFSYLAQITAFGECISTHMCDRLGTDTAAARRVHLAIDTLSLAGRYIGKWQEIKQ